MKEEFVKRKIVEMIGVPENGIFAIYSNRWWATDGENIFFYKGYYSPQCNAQKSIAEKICHKREQQVIFLRTVFVPHDCSDY